MPPKAKQAASAKKPASRVVEDKTFGMKNKNKSTKVQKYVAQVEKQVKDGGIDPKERRRQEDLKKMKADKKKDEEARKMEMDDLFKTVQPVQKVPFGVDPKTVVCIYFKKGMCQKGPKCKFSHDLNVERKTEKPNLYEDSRETAIANDTMDTWDEERLRQVVLSKHGNLKTTTDIVCKYFLEAVENGKYGWKWSCTNGPDCKYRHALPPGFVLKTKEQRALEKEAAKNAPTITLEDFLEVERHKLVPPLTPVTLASFDQWKKSRTEKRLRDEEERKKKREAEVKAGKNTGMTTGRELFEYDPAMLADLGEDDEGFDFSQFERDLDSLALREEEIQEFLEDGEQKED